jgi:hypothetical protein
MKALLLVLVGCWLVLVAVSVACEIDLRRIDR